MNHHRPNKFFAKKTEVDGIKFDSLKESRRWAELKLMERAGLIADLARQKRFNLAVNGVLVCAYVADHVYTEKGEEVVEDVKSAYTRKNPVYVLKKKLMKACLGIEIREV